MTSRYDERPVLVGLMENELEFWDGGGDSLVVLFKGERHVWLFGGEHGALVGSVPDEFLV